MKASHDLTQIPISFDEVNLVPAAGLIAPAALVQQTGLADMFNTRLGLARHGESTTTDLCHKA